ncbi:MAG: F420-dependent oxidoreductase [Deltaproteobacteria bacterium]|nr:F420-dependent oxidoreductase [Deltaproteobacteria bacterium]
MIKKPFRFAIQSFSARSAKEWRERAQKTEALGYSALHLADHILGPGEAIAPTFHPIQELAAVPAMAMAAEATSTLRIGSRVFCVDYRQPAVLAKEAATLDLLSDGRLELGLGAGWLKNEYSAIGIDFEPASLRIDRLAEVITLIKSHCRAEPLSLSGRHVHAKGYQGVPASVQKPHPPIMIGGGSRKILELAAREAQVVSFNFNNRSGVLGTDGIMTATAEATATKVKWVTAAAGDRLQAMEFEIGAYFVDVGDQADSTCKNMASAFGLEYHQMKSHPHGIFGTIESVCEELERRREIYGINYVTIGDDAMEDFAPVVRRLAGG